MKKTHFGAMLLILGSVGALLISLFAAANPWSYNGRTDFFFSISGNGLTGVLAVFCLMGIAGLAICVTELYIKPDWGKKETERMENIKESVKSMAEDIGNKIR